MNRPQLEPIQAEATIIRIHPERKLATGRNPVLMGYLIVSAVTFIYGFGGGFIVARVWF